MFSFYLKSHWLDIICRVFPLFFFVFSCIVSPSVRLCARVCVCVCVCVQDCGSHLRWGRCLMIHLYGLKAVYAPLICSPVPAASAAPERRPVPGPTLRRSSPHPQRQHPATETPLYSHLEKLSSEFLETGFALSFTKKSRCRKEKQTISS